MRAALIPHVVATLGWGEHNFAVLTLGCCALASLSKSRVRYPRKIWEAVDECGAVAELLEVLKTYDGAVGIGGACREALVNVTRGNKDTLAVVVKAGHEWIEERAAAAGAAASK